MSKITRVQQLRVELTRYQECIHEVFGLAEQISEDPTAIVLGRDADGNWFAWHEDYPEDGAVQLRALTPIQDAPRADAPRES